MGSYSKLFAANQTISANSYKNIQTQEAMTIPSSERFKRYKITNVGGGYVSYTPIVRYGTTTSMAYDTWYTDTSWINWSNGNKATGRFYNSSGKAISQAVDGLGIVFETVSIYNVTCAVSPSGSGTLTANYAKAASGDTVTLTVTPAEGYEFIGYTSSVTITNNTFTMPASAVTITANFKSIYEPETITFSITSEAAWQNLDGTIYLPKKIPPFSSINISYTCDNDNYWIGSLYLEDTNPDYSDPNSTSSMINIVTLRTSDNYFQLQNTNKLAGQSKLYSTLVSNGAGTITFTITYTPNGLKSRTISTNNISVLEPEWPTNNVYVLITFPKPIDNISIPYSLQYKNITLDGNYELSQLFLYDSSVDLYELTSATDDYEITTSPPSNSNETYYTFVPTAAERMQGAQSFLLECDKNDLSIGENPSFSITYGYEGDSPVPQIGYYNGRFFEPCTINYYNGTQFVECSPWYYNGTTWVPISTT